MFTSNLRFAAAAGFALASILPAAAICFDPVPDPIAAGWTQEGEGTFSPGARLALVDPGFAANEFITFRCSDPPMFQSDVVLTPRLVLDLNCVPTADGNLGIHVTMNDGASQFRAVLFREGTASVRVKVALPGQQFSPGFAFGGLTAEFSMTRRTNGSMVLSVAGPLGGQETYQAVDLPQTIVNNLEFGTYPVAASGTTYWETLGLPPVPEPGSMAALGLGVLALIRRRRKA